MQKKRIIARPISLRSFFFTAIFGVSLFMFITIYLITMGTYKKGYTAQSVSQTLGISNQISQTMQQLMEKGWSRKELFSFMSPIIEANKQIPIGINIYRNQSVVALFGAVDTNMRSPEVRQVMETGIRQSTQQNNIIKQVVAVKAKIICLSCHHNAKEGDILGVLEISQDLSSTISAYKSKFQLLFFLLLLF